MTLNEWYKTQNDEERNAFAERTGYSRKYIEIHLVSPNPKKIPPVYGIKRLADATDGAIGFYNLVDYYLGFSKDRVK